MENSTSKTVTCNKCGWVAFEVTREYAKQEVARFNEYFFSLPVEKQEEYYGGKKATLDFYERCMLCWGSYTNFRDAREGDCPVGCTLNPIIRRND